MELLLISPLFVEVKEKVLMDINGVGDNYSDIFYHKKTKKK